MVLLVFTLLLYMLLDYLNKFQILAAFLSNNDYFSANGKLCKFFIPLCTVCEHHG